MTPQEFQFRYRSPERWLEVFRTWYGPINRAFAALDAAGREALAAEIPALPGRLNRGGSSALIVPGEYAEVVIARG
ncbi:hypothetical protein [Albidovulum sp.]|uniref:hypothetical protein n=1 Tax=Albidovulum sp. TaxID=1872424 RepID=UPI0039B9BDAD